MTEIKTLAASTIEVMQVISTLEEKIEEGEDLPKELMKIDSTLSNFVQQVDNRIALIERLKVELESIKTQQRFYEIKKKLYTEILDEVKYKTKETLEEFPDVEFKGSKKKLSVQKNGGKAAGEWNLERVTVEGVIKPEDTQFVPEGYWTEVTFPVLDVKKIEADVRAGNLETDIFTLKPRGTSLRIR